MGIEPTSEAWEASILPLYDARSFQLPQLYLIPRPHEKPTARIPHAQKLKPSRGPPPPSSDKTQKYSSPP